MTQITGSRWWKFDFHTHTPFSTDTVWHPLIGTDDELSAEDWLRKYMEAKIDCVAVTDHNGGGWIDKLKSEYSRLESLRPDWFHELTLFPGVEISVNGGFHVLALFAPPETTSTIDSLLGAVGFNGTKGDPQQRTDQSCQEVAEKIVERGGICIPAHIDIENGIFFRDSSGNLKYDSQSLRQLMESGLISAVEVRDKDWVDGGLYQDLDPRLAHLLATDCHNFRGGRKPGEFFTWVKMGTPTLEGLRLALIDGSPLSILRSDESDEDPNRQPAMVIESVEVDNLRLMGRVDNQIAPMSPWLTTLIGGRGTGKSTIIDCLRLALERVDDLPTEIQDTFADFNKVAESRRARGSLLNDSRITVTINKDTGRFRLVWDQQSQCSTIQKQGAEGEWDDAEGIVRDRFPVRIMSQKEIFAIAKDPQSLIKLVDASSQLNLSQWQEQNQQLESGIRRLLSEKRELLAQTETRTRLAGELQEVVSRIELFEKGENQATLSSYQSVNRQKTVVQNRHNEVEDLVDSLQSVLANAAPSTADHSMFVTEGEDESEADKAAVALLDESKQKQADIVSQVSVLVAELRQFNSGWNQRVEDSLWGVHKTQVEDSYSELVQELEEAGIEDPRQYGSLVEKRERINQQLQKITEAEQKIGEIDQQFTQQLGALTTHRRELSTRRQAFLSEVLDDNAYVRVQVLPFGSDSRDCEETYRNAVCKPGGGLEKSILSDDGSEGILASLYQSLPAPPAERVDELVSRIQTIKNQTIQMHTTKQSIAQCDQWFAKHLAKLSPDQLDSLWLWYPEDVLQVDYRRGTNSDSWSPIEQGSPGQQTAAILAFLLSHGTEPIILDQPEDDLDNHLVYDLIVQQIRNSKRDRQIIIATHNPNIVVNGDAEMVLAMDVIRTQCTVHQTNSGCLQDPAVRQEVCKIMEGGQDAFVKRYQRIVQPNRYGGVLLWESLISPPAVPSPHFRSTREGADAS